MKIPHWILKVAEDVKSLSDKMMKEMMPEALSHLLPKMPNKMRVNFILKMTGIIEDQGKVGMSDEEKEDLVVKIIEKVRA